MRQCGAGGGDERVDLAAGASRGSVWSRDESCGAARARSEAMSVSEGRRSVRRAAAARRCERGRGVRCGVAGRAESASACVFCFCIQVLGFVVLELLVVQCLGLGVRVSGVL